MFETYLFLTSTQWCENKTKGLEPSDQKTILQYLTAKQTPTMFFILFSVGVCNRECIRKKGKKAKELTSVKDETRT